MKKVFNIFPLLLLILLVLCSFSSVNAEDTGNLTDGLGESGLNENICEKSLENDLRNNKDSIEDVFCLENYDALNGDYNPKGNSDTENTLNVDSNECQGTDLILAEDEYEDTGLSVKLNKTPLRDGEFSFTQLAITIQTTMATGHVDLLSGY